MDNNVNEYFFIWYDENCENQITENAINIQFSKKTGGLKGVI